MATSRLFSCLRRITESELFARCSVTGAQKLRVVKYRKCMAIPSGMTPIDCAGLMCITPNRNDVKAMPRTNPQHDGRNSGGDDLHEVHADHPRDRFQNSRAGAAGPFCRKNDG